MAETSLVHDRRLKVAYLDIKAAVDSVDRRALWKALRSRGVPDDYWISSSVYIRTPARKYALVVTCRNIS